MIVSGSRYCSASACHCLQLLHVLQSYSGKWYLHLYLVFVFGIFNFSMFYSHTQVIVIWYLYLVSPASPCSTVILRYGASILYVIYFGTLEYFVFHYVRYLMEIRADFVLDDILRLKFVYTG